MPQSQNYETPLLVLFYFLRRRDIGKHDQRQRKIYKIVGKLK